MLRISALVLVGWLATSSAASAAVECLFDPSRNSNVCRVLNGINCPKGGIVHMIAPFASPAYTLGEKNALGHFVFKAPPGWKFIPNTQYAQFTLYKKKAKILVHRLTEDEIECTWECKLNRSADAYVTGYCGAKARPL
jgi:hypothetical protein